ncbi:MAG: DUF5131 family protein, partial [Candidatus Bathyarchaeia archaeon]
MPLTPSVGDMYNFVDYTWNPLGGKCPHQCTYCYTKKPPVCWSKKYVGEQRLWEKELKTKLKPKRFYRTITLPFVPKDKFVVFVSSNNDPLTDWTPRNIFQKILDKCWENPEIYYLFQTKNPAGFLEFDSYPPNTILATTIETDIDQLCLRISKAPPPSKRSEDMKKVEKLKTWRLVSIEPKTKCHPDTLTLKLIKPIQPHAVSIGADSG